MDEGDSWLGDWPSDNSSSNFIGPDFLLPALMLLLDELELTKIDLLRS